MVITQNYDNSPENDLELHKGGIKGRKGREAEIT